jgi:hypothetical protein
MDQATVWKEYRVVQFCMFLKVESEGFADVVYDWKE